MYGLDSGMGGSVAVGAAACMHACRCCCFRYDITMECSLDWAGGPARARTSRMAASRWRGSSGGSGGRTGGPCVGEAGAWAELDGAAAAAPGASRELLRCSGGAAEADGAAAEEERGASAAAGVVEAEVNVPLRRRPSDTNPDAAAAVPLPLAAPAPAWVGIRRTGRSRRSGLTAAGPPPTPAPAAAAAKGPGSAATPMLGRLRASGGMGV